MSHGQVASLTIVRGSDRGRRVEWEGDRFVIGRKRGDLVLDDREVSGLHAAIERDGERHVLKDLGSTNGTWLDGRRISAAELAHGTHLKVGATYLLFELGPAAADEPEAGPASDEEPLVAASSGDAGNPFGELAGGGSEPEEELLEAEPLDDDAEAAEGFRALSSAPTRVPAAREPEPEPEPEVGPEVGPEAGPEAAEREAPAMPPSGRHAPTAPGGSLAPAGRHAPTSPGGSPPPPRVGVTSHGESRPEREPRPERGPGPERKDEPESKPSPGASVPPAAGSASWEALPLPGGSSPIPPSPGAAAAAPLDTPLPGESRPPAAPGPSPAAPGPSPAAPEGEEEVRLPSSIERSPHGLYLVVEAGRDRGRVFPIKRETTILGRSDIDVRIDDPDVSRKHVALELKGPGPHLLKDLGSTNGTLLNGVKVGENLISANDIIRMGSTRVKLVAGERAVRAELATLARD